MKPTIRVAALVVALAACHHEPAATPRAPADLPPLPPASGTPIGYLVDDASQLKLRDDQLSKLREIDDTLASELASLDAQSRPAMSESGGDATTAPHGGRGGKGHGGKGRHGGHRSPGGAAAPSADAAAAAARASDERTADLRSAIQRAFEVLDPDQRPSAEKILADHGIAPDAGGGSAAPASASDGASEEPTPEP